MHRCGQVQSLKQSVHPSASFCRLLTSRILTWRGTWVSQSVRFVTSSKFSIKFRPASSSASTPTNRQSTHGELRMCTQLLSAAPCFDCGMHTSRLLPDHHIVIADSSSHSASGHPRGSCQGKHRQPGRSRRAILRRGLRG